MNVVTNEPVDALSREQAASELDKNVIVLAGAGTGKTRLLIERICLLLLGKGVPVEQIVALTFTNKAAEEMRVRLETRLREIVDNPSTFDLLEKSYPQTRNTWQEKAAVALTNLPKAQIGTIHAFAAHLLRLYPIQSEVDPGFKEDEGEIFESVFEREWADWIREELKELASRRVYWERMLAEVELDDFKDLARAIASSEVDQSLLSKKVSLAPYAARWRSEIDAIVTGAAGASKETAFARGVDTLSRVLSGFAASKNVSPADLLELEGCDFSRPPKGWGATDEEKKQFGKRLSEVTKLTINLCRVDDRLIKDVLEGIKPFLARLKFELKRQGAVSFQGLLVFARDLVRNHPQVRAQLQRQYQTFLVDEFQDTDPLQGEILFYLSEEPGRGANEWRDIQLEPGRLFVVGDPKQSIYRFRGADIAAFQAFQKQMVDQGALEVVLSENFRTHAPMLTAVNEIFSKAMQESAGVQPAYAPLSSRANDEKRVGLEIFKVDTESNDDDPNARASREFEAELIAKWIRANVGDNGYRYGQIALLFRSANAFPPYLEAFKNHGIPYLAEGEKFFYQTHEVTQFLNLLSALAEPRDKIALVGVLRSPLGAMTDREILQLKELDGLDYRRTPPSLFDKKLTSLFELLRNLSEHARIEPVPSIIREVVEQTWAVQLSSQSRYGEQALANLFKIVRLAEKWNEQKPFTLNEFVQRFSEYRQDEREEGENPLADAQYDAVTMITIHKAKGLEFPVVFLPNMCAVGRGRPDNATIILQSWREQAVGLRLKRHGALSSTMVALEEDRRTREDAEEVRVFYVASTRAKERMFYLIRETSRTSQFAGYVKLAGAWPTNGDSDVELGGERIPVRSYRYQDAATVASPTPKPVPLGPLWNPTLLSTRAKAHIERYALLQRGRTIVAPTLLLNEPEKQKPTDEEIVSSRNHAIQVGLLCHSVLERWDFRTPKRGRPRDLKEAINREAAVLELLSIVPESARIIADAESVLAGFLESAVYEGLAKVTILGREIPFLYPLTSTSEEGPIMMRGVIDLLYEVGGRTVVADYKTNVVSDGNDKKIAARYQVQGDAYRQAVQKTLGRKSDFELIFLRSGRSIHL